MIKIALSDNPTIFFYLNPPYYETEKQYKELFTLELQQGFQNYVHYTDDGYSNGNFNWLIDDVRRIFHLNVALTKDLEEAKYKK